MDDELEEDKQKNFKSINENISTSDLSNRIDQLADLFDNHLKETCSIPWQLYNRLYDREKDLVSRIKKNPALEKNLAQPIVDEQLKKPVHSARKISAAHYLNVFQIDNKKFDNTEIDVGELRGWVRRIKNCDALLQSVGAQKQDGGKMEI